MCQGTPATTINEPEKWHALNQLEETVESNCSVLIKKLQNISELPVTPRPVISNPVPEKLLFAINKYVIQKSERFVRNMSTAYVESSNNFLNILLNIF